MCWESALSRRSSAMTSTTLPINSSPGTGTGLNPRRAFFPAARSRLRSQCRTRPKHCAQSEAATARSAPMTPDRPVASSGAGAPIIGPAGGNRAKVTPRRNRGAAMAGQSSTLDPDTLAKARAAGLDKALAAFPDCVADAARAAALDLADVPAIDGTTDLVGPPCAAGAAGDGAAMADRVRDRRGLCGAAAVAGRTGASAAARNRGAQCGLRRLHPRRCRGRAGNRAPGGNGHFRRPLARAVARHPARRERQYRYRRHADDLPFQNPARQHSARATRRPSPTCAPPAPSCWASSRCTNSRSAARPRSCRSRSRAIRGIPTITPADRRRAPAWRWPPALCRCRSAPTPAARSATRRAIAAWSD